MQIFHHRPLAAACAAMLGTAVCAFFLPFAIKLLWAGILLLSLIFALAFSRRFRDRAKHFAMVLVLVAMLISVLQSAWYFDLLDRVPQSIVDTDCNVECTVLDEGSAGAGYAYYTVRATSVNGVPTNFRAALECAYTATFHIGDTISVTALAQSVDTYYDPENRFFAIADGIRLGLISEDPVAGTILSSHAMPLRMMFLRWQENLTSRLLTLTGKQNGGLATALFLGNRDHLDDSISTYFRRSGVSHLLALSGMHVTLLLTLLTSLTVGIGLPKKGRLLLLSSLALGYLALTGFRVSAIRAVGMVLMLYLADFIGTRSDPLTTLCTVGAGMLLFSPSTVADGGFWMSFCAVFGLVTILPHFNAWLQSKSIPNKISSVIQAVAASVVAVVSVSFLSFLFCGEIAPIGILITVLLTPLLTLVLILIPLTLLLDILPLFSATPLCKPLSILLDLMIDMTDHVAHIPEISVSLRYPFAGIILSVMTAVLILMLILPMRRKIWIILPPTLAVLSFVVCFSVWNHLTYADAVQASYVVRSNGSALVITDRADTTIIDTSAGSYTMLRDAEKAARTHAVTEIDTLLLTHYHRAFVYSTERLAKRQIVHRVCLPLPQTESEYLILIAIRDRLTPLGTKIECYSSEQSLTLPGNLIFVRQCAEMLARSTQPVIAYTLQTAHELLTYTSISMQETSFYPTFRGTLERSDILIVGKDGPRAKTTLMLPETATPRLMLTDRSELLAYFDLSASGPLYRIPHITDITRHSFKIRK